MYYIYYQIRPYLGLKGLLSAPTSVRLIPSLPCLPLSHGGWKVHCTLLLLPLHRGFIRGEMSWCSLLFFVRDGQGPERALVNAVGQQGKLYDFRFSYKSFSDPISLTFFSKIFYFFNYYTWWRLYLINEKIVSERERFRNLSINYISCISNDDQPPRPISSFYPLSLNLTSTKIMGSYPPLQLASLHSPSFRTFLSFLQSFPRSREWRRLSRKMIRESTRHFSFSLVREPLRTQLWRKSYSCSLSYRS